MRLFALLLGCACLPCAKTHGADDPVTGLTTAPYNARSWLVEDGMPNNVVNCVAHDRRGFIWIGTLTGLARFDGTEFKTIELPKELTTRGLNIRGLAVEDGETIVILGANSRIFRLSEGVFSPHPIDAMIKRPDLLDLHVDVSGALWVGADEPALLRWKDGTLTVFTETHGLNRRGMRFTFCTDESGRTWISGGDFLGWYEQGALRRFEGSVGSSLIITRARSGGIWVASRERLARLYRERVTTVLTGVPWPAGRSGIQGMHEDHQGRLWIGTRRHGAWILGRNRLERVTPRDEPINDLMEGPGQNLWLATNGSGLFRMRERDHVLLDARSGLPENVSTAVCTDDVGAIWCANRSGGVARIEAGELALVPPLNPRRPPFVSTVSSDANGRIWFGGPSGLFRTLARDPTAVEEITPFFDTVRILYRASNEDMWVTANHPKLGYFRGDTFHSVAGVEEFGNERVSGLANDGPDRIWVSTESGRLFRIEDGTVHEEELPAATRPTRIHAIFVDSRNVLWLGSYDGLYRYAKGQLSQVSREHGLPDDVIHQLIEDDHARLWVGTRGGVFNVGLDNLHQLADNGSGTIHPRVFGRSDGLGGTSTILGGQPTAWKSPDGRIWFCTHRGIVGFTPKESSIVAPAPAVYIDAVRANGQAVPESTTLRLGPGLTRLVIQFSAPNFVAPESIRIRYELDGFDPDWNEAGSSRTATYTSLPPGDYTLRASASDEAGEWTGPETAVRLLVIPAWWQTWWLRSFVGLSATAGALWCGRRLSHRILRRRIEHLERLHALERERARIARDLHDELGGSLTRIGLLAERLQRGTQQSDMSAGLGQLAGHSRRLAGDLESIIWTVNPKNESWARLAQFIATLATRYFSGTPVACVTEGLESVPDRPIEPETLHHVIAIVKEALNNVLKHSGASQVRIAIDLTTGDRFSLRIRDNGCGFDPQAAENSERNGLNNMRTRIAEIHGSIFIESSPTLGSEIRMIIPIVSRRDSRTQT